METKIIAMYLPQYHRIPENDRWWGEGYTDWKAVKEAIPLFPGHEQPRVPLNDSYYDLSDVKEIKKQTKLASQYGIYGFGIYHYWFSSNQMLLNKPSELILNDKSIDTHYFFMWDNGSWKRTWSNVKFSNSWAPMFESDKNGPEILAELKYGDRKDWKIHFEYLMQFFRDERYIQLDGKPLFGIFNQNNQSSVLKEMFQYWNDLAIKNGFAGITILGRSNTVNEVVADYQFDYEPMTHAWIGKNNISKAAHRFYDSLRLKVGKIKTYDYDHVWRGILRDFECEDGFLPGAFVRYDDTPRRGKKSSIVRGEAPGKFEDYLLQLLRKSKKHNKEYIFLTAWNEWGEGAYLEPDSKYKYAYLESILRAIKTVE